MLEQLINQIMIDNVDLIGLDDVVEKEIIHHDILFLLHREGLLKQLTFIGGTSLRLCYNSSRLSEDLDFTGGIEFSPDKLAGLETKLQDYLTNKYGLTVHVRKPVVSTKNTSTWKVTIEKHSRRPDLPMQKMHIDICALPSFDIEHRPVTNHYTVNSAMTGLPIAVQSMTEMLADKMIAFAYRARRIKPRDVWDIVWLKQRNVKQNRDLVLKKLNVRDKETADFLNNLHKHCLLIQSDQTTQDDFYTEMGRFLPQNVLEKTLEQAPFWGYVGRIISEEVNVIEGLINRPTESHEFDMNN